MTLQAIKYDPNSDDELPKVDSEIVYKCKQYIIKKVQPIILSDLLKNGEPNKEEFDEVLIKENSTRPYLFYLVWLNKK